MITLARCNTSTTTGTSCCRGMLSVLLTLFQRFLRCHQTHSAEPQASRLASTTASWFCGAAPNHNNSTMTVPREKIRSNTTDCSPLKQGLKKRNKTTNSCSRRTNDNLRRYAMSRNHADLAFRQIRMRKSDGKSLKRLVVVITSITTDT